MCAVVTHHQHVIQPLSSGLWSWFRSWFWSPILVLVSDSLFWFQNLQSLNLQSLILILIADLVWGVWCWFWSQIPVSEWCIPSSCWLHMISSVHIILVACVHKQLLVYYLNNPNYTLIFSPLDVYFSRNGFYFSLCIVYIFRVIIERYTPSLLLFVTLNVYINIW